MYRLPRAFRLRQQPFVRPRIVNQLSQRRPQSRIAYRQNGEAVRFQSVRFLKSRFRSGPFKTIYILMIAACGFDAMRRAGIITIETVEESDQAQEMDDDKEFGDDDLFIPLTWGKKMPRTFYKGSDPEWQEFVKVAKDKKRHNDIQKELVQLVYSNAREHPVIKMQLGQDAKIGKYWLDISFPDGPPPEYERSGLAFGDGYIAWARERIDGDTQFRLSRALWPKAAFESLWASTKVLAGINYRRAKQALGLEEADPFSPEERYRHAMDMMEKQSQARERKEVGKAQLEPEGNSSAVVGTSSSSSPQASGTPSDLSKILPWQLQVPLPNTSSTASTDAPIFVLVFRAALSKQWNPKAVEPPRGTFVVQGLVEVRGSRGRVLLDVKSFYDPAQGKYVKVDANVRNFKRWNQAPRGGP